MKRLPGITISAIFLILGSLLEFLFALGAASAGLIEHSQIGSGGAMAGKAGVPIPAWMPTFMYGFALFLVALMLWGVFTAVGLFRLWRWARYSMLVIGGCLLLIGLPSMLVMLVLMFVPLPLPAGMDAAHVHTAQTVTKAVFGVVGGFYGIVCALGGFWLFYFNRKKVRDVFAGVPGQAEQSRRPFLISLVAVLSLIGGPACLLMVFLPFPGAFLGFILHGWQRAAVYLCYAALLTAAGVGLWRLKEWGRWLAIAVQFVGLAQYAVYIARPSLLTDYAAEVNRTMNVNQPQMPAHFQSMIYEISFGFGMLILIAIVWILIHYRAAFRRPIEPPQIESPALTS